MFGEKKNEIEIFSFQYVVDQELPKKSQALFDQIL